MSEREVVRRLIECTAMYTIVDDMTWHGTSAHLPKRQHHYPIAFWDGVIECWSTLESIGTDPSLCRYFNPLHDMNDAWLALKHAALGKPDHLANRDILATALMGTTQDEVDVRFALGFLCGWTPELICSAILAAYSVPGG
jgi:hypothetical protein